MADGENGILADGEKHPGGRPRLYDDPAIFAAKVEEYFVGVTIPSMAGIAYHLGFSDRDSFSNYADYGDEFSRTVKRAKLRIEQDRIERLNDKTKFTPGTIFDLKNNYGWKDQQDLNHTGTVSVQFATVYEQPPKG